MAIKGVHSTRTDGVTADVVIGTPDRMARLLSGGRVRPDHLCQCIFLDYDDADCKVSEVWAMKFLTEQDV